MKRHYLKMPGGLGYVKRISADVSILIQGHKNYDGYEVKVVDRSKKLSYEIGYTKTINQAKKLGDGYILTKGAV